ncbi:MAG: pentapeptide repeat-containing protein [Streptosporangiaceae bacterium]
MKQLNRWVLSCQDQVANIWYGQDHTVYGLNPTAGPQQPDNSNTVTVYDLGSGLIALQCPANPGAGIPAAFAWFTNEYSEYGTNLRFQYPWDGWVTQDWTAFQPVPLGDGCLVLYIPASQSYVQRADNPDQAASNCTALVSPYMGIHLAAHFTVTGVDRTMALDLLDLSAPSTGGKNASGLSFWGADLTGRDLTGWNLTGCDFARAVSLSGCNMSGANLQQARFAGHSLNGLDLSGADCTGADFSGCDFTGIKPATSAPVLTGANLMGAVLPAGISWPDVKMAGAVLAQAKVSGDFSGPTADLSGVNFNGQGASYFAPVYQGGGFGGFDLTNPADQVIAYDYGGSGRLDHLVCYRPGPGLGRVWIVRKNADGTFTQVYGQQGIGGYDMADPADRIIAYDYDGSGRLDYLVCYRPGSGAIFIVKKLNDTDSPDAFTHVYSQGASASAQGIGGYNLRDPADRIIAYDYDGSGRLNYLVCYRPGHRTVWILKKVQDADSPDAFTHVYHQGDGSGAQGIGGYDLAISTDRIIAYDYDGTGRLDHLVCYRSNGETIWILKKVSDLDDPKAFAPVYNQSAIGGYDLIDPRDQIIAYDYRGTGHLDHLVCYRPGTVTGIIRIVRKISNANDPSAFTPVYQGGGLGSGVDGSYDLAGSTDQIISCDHDGAGKPGDLICYRPAGNVLWIVQKKAAGPATLTACHLDHANLSGVSLAGIDLTTVTLAGADLSGASVAGAKLAQGADLTGAKLAGTDFTGLDLTQVHFSFPLTRSTDPAHPTIFARCKLPYTMIAKDWSCLDLTDATITGMPTDLTGLNAQGLRWPGGNFIKATLDGANFAGASLAGANFSGATSTQQSASFAGAKMPGAFFVQATLDQTDFTGTTLDGADRTEAANFSYACLSNCDFTGAGLYAVICTGATLIELTLSGGVNLQQADFSDAYLPNTVFTGADLQGAKFDGACMVACDLTNADLTPAAQGTQQASLGAACLQGVTLTGTKLGGASLPNAAITTTDGQITVQYYQTPGSLTDPYPMPYSGGSYPAASSLSDTTVCPNTVTYQENMASGQTIAQMMTAPNPPTQWKPRNTLEDQSRLARA